MQNKINLLLEQTSFLLEKQKELLDHASSHFDPVEALVDTAMKDAEQGTDEKKVEDLKFIYSYITEKKENIAFNIKEDMSFLEEQLKAIENIRDLEDKQKAEELLYMIIDKDEEFLDTPTFKEQVEKELEGAKHDLTVMIDDLKHALEEGDFNNLKLTLQAMKDEEEKQSCCSGCEQEADCSSCCGDNCSDDTNCCQSETDLFSAFKDEDNSLEGLEE